MSKTSWITSDDIMGKDVIDSQGATIGVVEKLFIDPEEVEIVGISIDKGFLSRGLMIGKEYIERVTPYAVFLTIRPSLDLKGLKVFDSQGLKIGTVQKVLLHEQKNQVEELLVQIGIAKQIHIKQECIESVGKNIVLNIDKKELLK